MATKKTRTKKATKPQPVAKPHARTTKAEPTAAQPAKKLSQFRAAIRVLAEAGEPMNCRAMIEAMQARGLWSSPAGRTPAQTLYASIIREIAKRGNAARFVKTDRGRLEGGGGKAKRCPRDEIAGALLRSAASHPTPATARKSRHTRRPLTWQADLVPYSHGRLAFRSVREYPRHGRHV
jgi:hypothetical protein